MANLERFVAEHLEIERPGPKKVKTSSQVSTEPDPDPAEGKRSHDQARDDDGKFASGGSAGSGAKPKTLKEQGYTDKHVDKLIKEDGVKGAMERVKNAESVGKLAHTSSTKTMTAPERESHIEDAKTSAKEAVPYLKEAEKASKAYDKSSEKVSELTDEVDVTEQELEEAPEYTEDDWSEDKAADEDNVGTFEAEKKARDKERAKLAGKIEKLNSRIETEEAEKQKHEKAFNSALKKARYKIDKAAKLADEAEFGEGEDEEGSFDVSEGLSDNLEDGYDSISDGINKALDELKSATKSKIDKKHKAARRVAADRARVKKAVKPLVDAMDKWTVGTTAALSAELGASIAKGIDTLKAIFDRSVRDGYTDANKSAFEDANLLPKSGVLAGDFRKALKAHYVNAVAMAEAEIKSAVKESKGKRATGKTAGGVDNWIESFGKRKFDKIYNAITESMRDTFLTGINSGWDTDEFVTQIKAKAPALAEKEIERVVRTASTDIFTIGRQAVAEESGDVVAYRYQAILEPERTCELCYNADGLEVGIHDPDVDRFLPPSHPACRCTVTYITTGEEWETDTRQLADFVNGLESEYGGNLR